MAVREIRKGLYAVGSQDWNRRLFDSLIPTPEGTSYNSYLVVGSEKTALIDAVDPTKVQEMKENLEELGIEKLDYIVSHHAEQDHSGGIPDVLEWYPEAKVVTNQKCIDLERDHLHIPEERFIRVEDGDTLSLGDRTIEFIMAPWVHWPETMFTYLREEKVLFTCDFLGSHLATSDLFVRDKGAVCIGAKRYYAEIMMPFRHNVKMHLQKVRSLDVEIIAPSHGPLYDDPDFILSAYEDWSSDKPKNEAVVAYVSMHDSTRLMADHLISALVERGITVKVFDLTVADLGELAMALVDAATILIGTPTVLAGPHPLAVNAVYLANALRPKAKYAGIFGSFGWGGRTVDILKGLMPALQVELLEPVLIKGMPREEDYRKLDELADVVKEKHSAL